MMMADEAHQTPAASTPSEATSGGLTPYPLHSQLVRGGAANGAANNSNNNSAALGPAGQPSMMKRKASSFFRARGTAPPTRNPGAPRSLGSDAEGVPTDTMERILQTGQPTFSTQLDFLKTNRTVAAFERAVERLELLSLLDTAAPADEDATAAAAAGGRGNATTVSFVVGSGAKTTASREPAPASTALNATPAATLRESTAAAQRGAAVLDGELRAATVATAQKVSEALATRQLHGDRGRPSVLELLAEQRRLERRYGELLVEAQPSVSLRPGEPQLRSQCFANVQNPRQAAVRQELESVSRRLRDTNRLLSTQLQDNPQDADNWAKVLNERRELTALLKEVIVELTAGYTEVFQQQQRARKAEGSGEGGTANGFNSYGSQRVHTAGGDFGTSDSARASSASPGGTNFDLSTTQHLNGSVVSGVARINSRRSSPVGGCGGTTTASESESQQAALRRFGSTVQRRHTSKSAHQAPRIPLTSSYRRFAVKVLQEEAAQRWADGVLAKERSLNQNVKQLQADLMREQEAKDKEVAERQARLSELRMELRKLKAATQQRTEAATARGEATTESLEREGVAEIHHVRQAMQQNERLLSVEANSHRDFCDHLRQRSAAADALATSWETKTQREQKKKEVAKIDAEGSRQACAQRLTELENEQAIQLELKKQRDAKLREEEDECRRAEEQRSSEYAAASVLEAALKAMMTRQTLNKLKKVSKKKKKQKA